MSDICQDENAAVLHKQNMRSSDLLLQALRKCHPEYGILVEPKFAPKLTIATEVFVRAEEVEERRRDKILSQLEDAKLKFDRLVTELYEMPPITPMMSDIIRETCLQFNVSKLGVLSPRRDTKMILPRFVICYLAREWTKLSLPEIGRLMGGRDHTTVLNAIRRTEEMVASGSPVIADIDDIKTRVFEKVEARVRMKNEIDTDLRDCFAPETVPASSPDRTFAGAGSERTSALSATE